MKNQKQQSYVSILKSLLCPQPDSWLYEKEKKKKGYKHRKKNQDIEVTVTINNKK